MEWISDVLTELSKKVAETEGVLVNDHPGDGPSLVLLSRSVDAMVNPEKYSAVWDLPGK
jgi:hypothetical protein